MKKKTLQSESLDTTNKGDAIIEGKITTKFFKSLINCLTRETGMVQINEIPKNGIEQCKKIILNELPEGRSFKSSCILEDKQLGQIIELGKKTIYTVTKEDVMKYGTETLSKICQSFGQDALPHNDIHILFLVEGDLISTHTIYGKLIALNVIKNHHGRGLSARGKTYTFGDLFSSSIERIERQENDRITMPNNFNIEELFTLLKNELNSGHKDNNIQ